MNELLQLALSVLCFVGAAALVAVIVFAVVFLRWLYKEVDDGQGRNLRILFRSGSRGRTHRQGWFLKARRHLQSITQRLKHGKR